MDHGRREKKAIETRESIVRAARTLFERDGYAETTVDQIAERSDISTRTFFRYFPNKEALLFAELDDARSSMLDALDQRPADEDPMTSLAVVFSDYADVFEERYDELTWGFRMCEEFEMDGVYERSMIKQHSHERVAAFLAQRMGIDPDSDPTPSAIAAAVMSVFGAAIKARVSSLRNGEPHAAGATAAAFGAVLGRTAIALAAVSAQTADQCGDVVHS